MRNLQTRIHILQTRLLYFTDQKLPTKLYESTILDINFCTNVKCGQKVLFREPAESAYFRSAICYLGQGQ